MTRVRWLGVLAALFASAAAWAEIQPMAPAEMKRITGFLEAYFKERDPQRRDAELLKKAEQEVTDIDSRRARAKKSSVLADVDGLREALRESQSYESPRSRGLKPIEWKESPFPRGDARFQVSVPRRYRPNAPTPLIIAFAPKGMTAEDYVNRGFLKNRVYQDTYLIVAPEWPDPKKPTWGTETPEGCGRMLVPLAYVSQNFFVDTDRIYVVGADEGAPAALDLAMSYADLFAAVFTIAPAARDGAAGIKRFLLRNLEMLPVHRLTGAGESPYPEAHDEVLTKIEGESVLTRDLFPRKVDWTFNAPSQQRAYWLLVTRQRALPKDEIGRLAAEIKDGNQIEITAKGVDAFTLFLNDRLVNLDEPVQVTINGVKQEPLQATRSLLTAVDWMMLTGDIGRAFPAEHAFTVPLEEKPADNGKPGNDGIKPADGGQAPK